MKNINLAIKRTIDVLGSAIGAIIISPMLIVIALLIKFSSKGPVLFKQERLGRSGHIFTVVKFRTMVVNAEDIGDGLFIKSETDERITKIGKKLRLTSLDELPQLWNVFIGDMSLVGPRPPATYFPYDGYGNYPAWAKKRFEMKPGMTGLAQIQVRNAAPWDERILIDIDYVKRFNVLLDIKILFLTLSKIFNRESILYSNTSVDKEKLNV